MDKAWLDRLEAEGSLGQSPRDPDWVARVLADAHLDLEWAKRKLEGELAIPRARLPMLGKLH